LNVMMTPWSIGDGSEGVSLKRYSALVFGCSRQRSCQNPGILQVQGWPWCLILGLSYSLQFILHSHGLLPHHRLKIISVYHLPATHTHSTSYLFEEWVMTAFLTFAHDEGTTPDLYFPSWNKLLCLHCNSTQLQQGLFPCLIIQHLLFL
jgi:hypothetical protein